MSTERGYHINEWQLWERPYQFTRVLTRLSHKVNSRKSLWWWRGYAENLSLPNRVSSKLRFGIMTLTALKAWWPETLILSNPGGCNVIEVLT